MSSLRLLGGVSVEGEQGALAGRAGQRHRVALLALVATAPTRTLSRDKLLAYLWPESKEERGRHLLSESLYVLRKALGDDAIPSEGDKLRLNLEVLSCDACEFEAAIERGDLEHAVSLYAGPFLDGFFLRDAPEFGLWADGERDRFARLYSKALESLAEEAEKREDLPLAVDWWRRLVAEDPLSSRITVRLAEALDASGDRAAALRQILAHAELLRDELGVQPGPEVTALAQRLTERVHGAKPAIDAGEELPQEVASKEPKQEAARPLRAGRRARRVGLAVLALLIVVVSARLLWQRATSGTPESSEVEPVRMMLVVLPFQHLGAQEDQYFTDGVTEEITTRLAKVSDLGVIARTSAVQYKDTDKTVQQIGEELGVAYILEGAVRWEKSENGQNRVRITPQLIRVSDATHLWAESYEEAQVGVFGVQSDISERVAEALGITLHEPQLRSVQAKPTEDPVAYDYYLRGIDYAKRGPEFRTMSLAIEMLERAVALDSNFARAHVTISSVHSLIYQYRHDRTEERLAKARAAVDRALELDPNLAEAHQVLGLYYYRGYRDYEHALEQFDIAQRLNPNDGSSSYWMAMIQRRQGEFVEAARNVSRAVRFNPRAAILNQEAADTYNQLRDYTEARRFADAAIALRPDVPSPYHWKVWGYLNGEADPERAHETIQEALQKTYLTFPYFEGFAGRAMARILHDRYQKELRELTLNSYYPPDDTADYFILKALSYRETSQPELAHAYYDSARAKLEEWSYQMPDDAVIHSYLGVAYAGLGRKDDAIREGRLAVGLLPVTKDALDGPGIAAMLAEIYVMVGEYDAAVEQLEFLLSIPCDISTGVLELDPIWDPLRDHPRFQALLQRYRR
jgi:serine/threonine-protein kinase